MPLKPRLPFTKTRKCCIMCASYYSLNTVKMKKKKYTMNIGSREWKREKEWKKERNYKKKRRERKKHAHFKRITDQNEWTKLANERKPMEEKQARNQKQEPKMQLRTGQKANKNDGDSSVANGGYIHTIEWIDEQWRDKEKKTTQPNISAANKVDDSFHSNKTENFTFQTTDRDRQRERASRCVCVRKEIYSEKVARVRYLPCSTLLCKFFPPFFSTSFHWRCRHWHCHYCCWLQQLKWSTLNFLPVHMVYVLHKTISLSYHLHAHLFH